MALIGDALANAALFQPSDHSIGSFFPDVAIREVHRDAMVVTQHPVEGGGVVSDHVFRRPAELELEYGFSNATAGSDGYVQQRYAAALRMKDARQLQRIYTAKRAYQNMIVADVATATDERFQASTILLIRCIELIVVSTQTTGTDTDTTKPGAEITGANGSTQAAQANPESTGGITDRGTIQTQSIGSQQLAGAYNPGAIETPAPITGNFNIAPLSPVEMSGISPPTEITLPQLSVGPESVGGLQAAGPDQYSMFGAGP